VRRGRAAALLLALPGALVVGCSSSPPTAPSDTGPVPLVIGHRGIPELRPEHTAAGYRLAAEKGADYLEPDLVPTKDGHLVVRHEPDITQTTDVADHPEFARLRTNKTIAGARSSGWFTSDFTLAQLQTLRTRERVPQLRPASAKFDGEGRIMTLQQVIDLARSLTAELKRPVGIVPEVKHGAYFRSVGLAIEPKLLEVLRTNGLTGSDPPVPVLIQSFEPATLRWFHERVAVPLVQLAATGVRTTPDLLRQVAAYAQYGAVDRTMVVPRDASGKLLEPTTLVDDAHDAGLKVLVFTFADENQSLPLDFRRGTDPTAHGDAAAEYRLFLSLGVDGVFSDDADAAAAARADWIAAGRPHA